MSDEIRYTAEELRRNVWRSLHMMQEVSGPILVGTIEGLSLGNARTALRQLEVHGYVMKYGGRVGGCHQKYVRARNVPLLPAICECCGGEFAAKTCDPSLKEIEREREREKEKEQRAATWHQVPAEIKERLEKRLNDEEVSHDAA